MINDLDDPLGALAVLELRGGDTTSIEAKHLLESVLAGAAGSDAEAAREQAGQVILLRVGAGWINVVGVDDVARWKRAPTSENGFARRSG